MRTTCQALCETFCGDGLMWSSQQLYGYNSSFISKMGRCCLRPCSYWWVVEPGVECRFMLQNPSLHCHPVVLPRDGRGQRGRELGGKADGQDAGWGAFRPRRGEAGEAVRSTCGEDRVSRVGRGSLCPGCSGGAAGDRQSMGPLCWTLGLASAP